MDKFDIQAAQAHRKRLKQQAGYSAKNRDKVAMIGAPQRDHVAAAVLHVVLRGHLDNSQTARKVLVHALAILETDGYDGDATWARMEVMARQPRRKLKPPKPKAS